MQVKALSYIRPVIQALVPDVLPDIVLRAAEDGSSVMHVLRTLASLRSESCFWLGWFLWPGLQVAYYAVFFASVSPIKVVYTIIIGIARTFVEVTAFCKCIQACFKQDRRTVIRSLLCCYVLPMIMTFQSLSVLMWMCVFLPSWIVHISMVAFCLWGPPAMIALMSSAWQPQPRLHVPAGGVPAHGPRAVVAADGNRPGRLQGWTRKLHGHTDSVHWPPPLQVPDYVEDCEVLPRYFLCPITHSVMREPAVAATGASYERKAILEWLKTRR
eukprot:jgi/Chrzof1/8853/Cz03g26190.t1